MNSACPINLIRTYKSISFSWKGKHAARKGKVGGKDVGNSDVPECCCPPSSLPFLFIIREPNKAKVNAVIFRLEVFHKEACLKHADYIGFLVLSFGVFYF
jgi:hypothetical protein